MASVSTDEIRESLEQSIIEREFGDGERLDEVQLARRFSVSRTPLREALRMLSGSGLVELIPHRGAYVRYPGIVEIVEMFEVMAELEALCGRLAARRISSSDLVELTVAARACERAAANNDPDDYYHRNETFHQQIYRTAGNGFLASEALRLQKRLRPFRRMQLRSSGRLAQSLSEHSRILDAITKGDANRAAEELRNHVAVQAERFNTLIAHYEKGPELSGR
mgnify:CR=1 FL=1|jgi:Transcriptional regulators